MFSKDRIKITEEACKHIQAGLEAGHTKRFTDAYDVSTKDLPITRTTYKDLLLYSNPEHDEGRIEYERQMKKIAGHLLIKLISTIKNKDDALKGKAELITFFDKYNIETVIKYLIQLHRSNLAQP